MPLLTPVTPTYSQTNRQDLNDFLMAMIAAFQVTQPAVVRKAWSEIPASISGEVPLVYLGPITETITHDQGTRIRRFDGVIGYLDNSPESQEANARANAFADFFIEWFTANPHVVSDGSDLLQQTGLTEGGLPINVPQTAHMDLAVNYFYNVQVGRP